MTAQLPPGVVPVWDSNPSQTAVVTQFWEGGVVGVVVGGVVGVVVGGVVGGVVVGVASGPHDTPLKVKAVGVALVPE